jgi:HAD superfamily hydrolase (TIGR01450 family)
MPNVVCDLDGVLWSRSVVLPGAQEALELLSRFQINVFFVSNNSFVTVSNLEERISDLGFDARGRVITSPMVVAAQLPANSRIFVLAGEGTEEALSRVGHLLCAADEDPEYVVVGLRTDFDYKMLTTASLAIRAGAQLIGTNDDPAYPTEDGLLPGGGAILAAIATASESCPTVFGKPYPSMVSYVKKRFNDQKIDYVIGDRIDHDGQFAVNLDSEFINVLSDATTRSENRITSVSSLLEAVTMIINHSNSIGS